MWPGFLLKESRQSPLAKLASVVDTLHSPRDGVPTLSDTPAAVHAVAESLRAGDGPVAVDTERASGFRFDDRAFLLQLRRTGAGTHLVDPAAVPEVGDILAPVMNSTAWILHAAHSDLPALTTLGWRTPQLHDTQIAGRLLGYGQIGLARMLEEFLDVTVAKDKGREDWSARPVPEAMLTYAALDVELLIDLLETATPRLESLGRADWYRQECDHVHDQWSRPVSQPDWTRLRGLGHVRDPRGLEVVRRLVDARTDIARARDIPPEHVLRASAILEVAQEPGRASRQLSRNLAGVSRLARSARGSAGSGIHRDLKDRFTGAVGQAMDTTRAELPERPRTVAGHPDHRTWSRDHPVADRLATGFREGVDRLASTTGIKAEDLLTVRSIRSVAWTVSLSVDGLSADIIAGTGTAEADPVGIVEELLGGTLADKGCRDWQISLLVGAFLPVVAATAATGVS